MTPHATLSDRLRESAEWYLKCSGHERDFIAARQMQEAAAELERLPVAARQKVEHLHTALAPFARAADSFHGDDADDIFKISTTLRVRHLRAAADAISQPG